MSDEKDGYYFPGGVVSALRSYTTPSPRFNGVPCEHYRKVMRYKQELANGGHTVPREEGFEGTSPAEIQEWSKTLPPDAKIGFNDWNGIFAQWGEFIPLTEEEVSLRKTFIETHPIPEGDPDPVPIRWRRSVPFEVTVK